MSCKNSNDENTTTESTPFKKGQRVFPEAVLKKWGYETVDLDNGHYIKSIKNYGNSEKAFYARFHLGMETYKNAAEAIQQSEAIEEKRLSGSFSDKDYIRTIQKDEVVYFISPTSNYTYLQHQPKLMEDLMSFLKVESHPKKK